MQRDDFEAGAWVGKHSHAGNQLVVLLDDTEIVYKESGKERTETYKAGDILWVEAAEHDHKVESSGSTLK